MAHYPYHIGQLVFLAKMIRNEDWKNLSIRKGKSAEYNTAKFGTGKTNKRFTNDV